MKFEPQKKDIWISIGVFLMLETLIISFYYNFNFKPSVQSALSYRLKDEVKVSNAFLNSYRVFASSIFDSIINKENITRLIYQYDQASPKQKDVYRQQLYDSLKFVYDVIKYKNFSIFHFHDPQGKSILRFHKPWKYGDKLTDFRKSIGIIIRKHQYFEGFEEGRIVNSYRFIFPLFYHQKYVGSVELSVSMIKLLKEREKSFLGTFRLLLKDSIYQKIVNPKTQKFYSPSDYDGYRSYNLGITKNSTIPDSIIHFLDQKVKKSLNDVSILNKPVIKWVKYDKNNYLITFFPVRNILGEQVALVVAYEIYEPINSFLNSFKTAILIATLLSLIMSVVVLFVNWGRRQAIEREKIVQKAKERAEEIAELKSSFLANMSHEIRTPMNGVVGMTEILKQTKLTKEQKDFVSIIESSAGSLLNVINDILDFSKIESNKIELEAISFHIRKLIEDVADTLILNVEKKGLSLLTYIDPAIPEVVIGDPVRLKQVLLNLANNAVKFTEEGEVVISAELVKMEKDETGNNKKATILFKVKDTGIGIAEESKKRLFKAFTQADATINRKYGGTGLGLTISKRLVELMGGSLELESEVGKGSEFYFKLSFKIGSQTIADYFSDTEDLSRLRVMVLDDNESNRIIFKKYFSYWGIRCDEAGNVDEAVKKVKKAIENHHPYNLIIVDFQMPNKTGFDFANILKNENLKRNTKLILFSSISDMIDIKTIHKYGFDAYLYKPIKYTPFRKIVFETINKDVDHKLKKTDVIEKEKTNKKVKNDGVNFNTKILLAEDNLINQKVATVILEKMGFKQVDVANNGIEAVQLHLKNHYDLILMDIQMPDMDGIEAAHKIIEHEKSVYGEKRTKIVALTANALEKDIKKYMKEGMDAVLTKPFKRDDLLKILRWFL